MATAHMIHGYVGSGKTTLALRLEQDLGAVRFTHDEWMRELYGVDPSAADFDDAARRVSALMEKLWTACLTADVDVILDLGFWKRVERDRVRALVASLQCDARLYHLQCDEDVAWARVERRNADPNLSLHIAAETFQALKSQFEPVLDDEQWIESSSSEGA